MSGLVLLPDFKLRLFLKDAHKNWRFLRHVLGLDVGEHAVGERLHVTAAHAGRALGIAARQGKRGCDRSGRQERAHGRPTMQRKLPRTDRLPQAFFPTRPLPRNGWARKPSAPMAEWRIP